MDNHLYGIYQYIFCHLLICHILGDCYKILYSYLIFIYLLYDRMWMCLSLIIAQTQLIYFIMNSGLQI